MSQQHAQGYQFRDPPQCGSQCGSHSSECTYAGKDSDNDPCRSARNTPIIRQRATYIREPSYHRAVDHAKSGDKHERYERHSTRQCRRQMRRVYRHQRKRREKERAMTPYRGSRLGEAKNPGPDRKVQQRTNVTKSPPTCHRCHPVPPLPLHALPCHRTRHPAQHVLGSEDYVTSCVMRHTSPRVARVAG